MCWMMIPRAITAWAGHRVGGCTTAWPASMPICVSADHASCCAGAKSKSNWPQLRAKPAPAGSMPWPMPNPGGAMPSARWAKRSIWCSMRGNICCRRRHCAPGVVSHIGSTPRSGGHCCSICRRRAPWLRPNGSIRLRSGPSAMIWIAGICCPRRPIGPEECAIPGPRARLCATASGGLCRSGGALWRPAQSAFGRGHVALVAASAFRRDFGGDSMERHG